MCTAIVPPAEGAFDGTLHGVRLSQLLHVVPRVHAWFVDVANVRVRSFPTSLWRAVRTVVCGSEVVENLSTVRSPYALLP